MKSRPLLTTWLDVSAVRTELSRTLKHAVADPRAVRVHQLAAMLLFFQILRHRRTLRSAAQSWNERHPLFLAGPRLLPARHHRRTERGRGRCSMPAPRRASCLVTAVSASAAEKQGSLFVLQTTHALWLRRVKHWSSAEEFSWRLHLL